MKGSPSKLLTGLVALVALTFLSPVTVATHIPGSVMTTLAIDVGSSAARVSVLVGTNGLGLRDTGEPRIIWTGPGTHSLPGPLESNWTAEGYLLIKDGTDEAQFVHPSNTLFNLDLPVALRSENNYRDRPRIAGFQAFTLTDITGKYLDDLATSAETIIGHKITTTVIVLRNGHNIRTTANRIINDKRWGNYTSYDSVSVGGHETRGTERGAMLYAFGPRRTTEVYWKTSAAIFPFDNGMEYSRAVLVYRLGGSRFEVSVHKVDRGTFNIMSSVYEQHLGGNDFNRRVVDHLLQVHKNKTGEDLSGDNLFLLRLGSEVEKAKEVLSVQDWVQIEVESPQSGSQGLSELLTRRQFEELNMDLFNKTITAIDRAISDSLLYTKDDIQDIVFAGGSANIPFLQSTIREYFGPQKKYHGSSHLEDTIVLGAAKLGHWYQDSRHSLDEGLCHCISDDGHTRTATLGIETAGGVMFKYSDPKSMFTNKMYTFSTTKDNQDRVIIRVFEGVRKWTHQNRFLGGIELTGILPAPKGVPQIRVRISTYGCGNYVNLYVMEVASGRTNATIFPESTHMNDYYGPFEYQFMDEGAPELEPAGALTLLQSP